MLEETGAFPDEKTTTQNNNGDNQKKGTFKRFPHSLMSLPFSGSFFICFSGSFIYLIVSEMSVGIKMSHDLLTFSLPHSLLWATPFVGVLASLALIHLLAPQFWHHHYGKVLMGWTLVFLSALGVSEGLPT